MTLRGRYTPINYQSLADSLGPLIDLGDLGDVTYSPIPLGAANQYDHLEWTGSEWQNVTNLTMGGDILVATGLGSSLDIGTSLRKFKDLYLNGDAYCTRFLVGTTVYAEGQIGLTSGGTLTVLGNGANLTLQATTQTSINQTFIANGNTGILGWQSDGSWKLTSDRNEVEVYLFPSAGTTGVFTWVGDDAEFNFSHKIDVTGAITASGVITALGGNSTNWNTAYGWGDHGAVGYLTDIVQDTTPQLGGDLDGQSTYDITGVVDITASGDITCGSTAFHADASEKTVGIGASALDSTLLYLEYTKTLSSLTDAYGIYLLPTFTCGQNMTAIRAMSLNATVVASSNTIDRLDGVSANIAVSAVAGTVTLLNGLTSAISRLAGKAGTTVVESNGLWIPSMIGAMQTVAGIRLDEQTVGTTANWQILCGGGNSHLGDKVRIGDGASATVPTDALEVTGVSVLGDGGTTDYMTVEADGDTYWNAGGGMVFSELYVKDGAAEVTISSAGYTKWTQWTTVGNENGDIAASAANDNIIINKIGRYLLTLSAAISCDLTPGASFNILTSIFLNGVEQNNLHVNRAYRTLNARGVISISGIIDVVTSGHAIDVRSSSNNAAASQDLLVEDANLTVVQIGGHVA